MRGRAGTPPLCTDGTSTPTHRSWHRQLGAQKRRGRTAGRSTLTSSVIWSFSSPPRQIKTRRWLMDASSEATRSTVCPHDSRPLPAQRPWPWHLIPALACAKTTHQECRGAPKPTVNCAVSRRRMLMHRGCLHSSRPTRIGASRGGAVCGRTDNGGLSRFTMSSAQTDGARDSGGVAQGAGLQLSEGRCAPRAETPP